HGTAIITRLNKGIERTIFICLNAAFLSAANSACKVLDSLRLEEHDQTPPKGFNEAYKTKEDESSDLATDKQKSYLLQLISLNISDEGEREQFASTVDEMTRSEASETIQRFTR
ncbi:MAG: hypothetical protein Q7R79_02675, partial [bacterium]|nr:hypothetical protein [bacterium]